MPRPRRPWWSERDRFGKLVKEARAADIEIPEGMTLYWFRSSYITDAIQAGLSGDAAADLGGNTREIARQHYHYAQQEYLRQIHERVMKGRGESDGKQ